MTRKVPFPRWLIVVQRDKRDLYSNLRQSFEADGRVEVILDRRQADRRAEGGPVGAERRRQQRRKALTAREVDIWQNLGFRLYYQDEDMKVYEAEPEPSGKTVPDPDPQPGGKG
jgi:hypothetical protein